MLPRRHGRRPWRALPQSASGRITVCFESNHSLLRVELQSASSRITLCFESNQRAAAPLRASRRDGLGRRKPYNGPLIAMKSEQDYYRQMIHQMAEKTNDTRQHPLGRPLLLLALMGTCALSAQAQRVDLDMSGRNPTEVSAKDYISWMLPELKPGAAERRMFGAVAVTLTNTSATGKVRTGW